MMDTTTHLRLMPGPFEPLHRKRSAIGVLKKPTGSSSARRSKLHIAATTAKIWANIYVMTRTVSTAHPTGSLAATIGI